MTEQEARSLTAWERSIVHAAADSNNNAEITFTAENSADLTGIL